MSFVHLHCHSQYSLLDGVSRIPDLVQRASDLGMKAMALTDHGNIYGAVKFYKEALKVGIKPVIGCEVYLTKGSRFDRPSHRDAELEHLVLLVENAEGYRNLAKLVTFSYLEGFHYKPRVDLEALKTHHTGLIALSACLSGVVSKSLHNGRLAEAKEKALALKEIFGKDSFYLEMQYQKLEGQLELNEKLRALSRELDIPMVVSNDSHYVRQEDAHTQDVLLCIQTGSNLADTERMRFHGDQFYVKSEEEMRTLFSEDTQALENTGLIADRCNFTWELDQLHLPDFDIPEDASLPEMLEKECRKTLSRRYDERQMEQAEARLSIELGVIEQMGFSAYFLIVGDFVNYAKQAGIRVGPGRGSAAGSIVSYLLGITDIDPLKYSLLFERFLNPARKSMPDIDIDFDDERRGEVIAYVAQKYGQDRVAQIITFTKMAARSATRDAGRVLGYSYAVVDRIAKKIPAVPGRNFTIDDALSFSEDLRTEYESNEEAKVILDTARPLVGAVRQDSIHAAGVVIAPRALTDFAALQRKGESEVLTQFEMEDIQSIGLLKMDFLGLRTLTVISDALRLIRISEGRDLDLNEIPLDDRKAFDLLKHGHTFGVFQLESSGMRDLLRGFRPESMEDIIAIVALYRPGPMDLIPDFIERKNKRKKIEYLDPALESILSETYGVMVYQEQVMQVAAKFSGFSMAEADILRQAISKKKTEMFGELREKFANGAEALGNSAKKAHQIFDLIVEFADYGFNKSHAAAYAMVAYQTAYLKSNYPQEFMAALLSSVKDDQAKVASYIQECRRIGIPVLPPDVNESDIKFSVSKKDDRKTIRFGLSAIRNIGAAAIETIITARQDGKYQDFHDFCARVGAGGINRKTLESLIRAGAFDSFGTKRRAMMLGYEKVLEEAALRHRDSKSGQFSLFGEEEMPAQALPEIEEFKKDELLAGEKEMLGLYVTDHPLLGKEALLALNRDYEIAALQDIEEDMRVKVAGLITKVLRKPTKRGDLMCFIQLEDLSGSIEIIAFAKVAEAASECIKEDVIVTIAGRLDIRDRDESKEIKLVAQDIKLLNDSASQEDQTPVKSDTNGRFLKLKLPLNGNMGFLLDELKSIMREYQGNAPVYIELCDGTDNRKLLKLGEAYQVDLSQGLFARIKELLPRENVFISGNGKIS